MDNVAKLLAQIRGTRPGLRIDCIIHEKDCTPPCHCHTRAIVIVRERANTRAGYRDRRRIVRLDVNAPEPTPWAIPEPEPYEPPAKLPKMPLFRVDKTDPDVERRKK